MSKKKYQIIDLFAGCGGISKGFSNTGKVNIVGAIDFDKAACNTYQLNFPNAKVICGDINNISVESTGFKNIDIIIGGPPCQGFSRLNYQYLRFVEELQPKAILIENVKNVLVAKNGYVPLNVTRFLEDIGYTVNYSIVCASDFGVPQNRYRAIFVALKKEYGKFDFDTLIKYKKKTVSVEEAISDIQSIEGEAKKLKQGTVFFLPSPQSDYQKNMQAPNGEVHNHMIYYPADNVQAMMRFVPEGGNWRCVPKEMFKSQRTNRYTNYLRRLKNNEPSITIDTGHNVYFHPIFDRVPTIRESARLQSFPDTFIFTGNKGEQFRQVGNAVPPLMAEALARAIIETIEQKEHE